MDWPIGEEVVAAAVVGVQIRFDDDVDAGEIEVLSGPQRALTASLSNLGWGPCQIPAIVQTRTRTLYSCAL